MATQLSEPDLIFQAQAGDLEAFNQLVLRHQDGLYRYVFALVGERDLAADITQESFVKAFRNIKSLQGNYFRRWLFTIATNTARDIARQRARHPMQALYPEDENYEEFDSPYWLIDPRASVEDTVQSNEFLARVGQLLGALPEAQRSILTLIDVQEMNYFEAAEILNIPLGTVKSRLARARMQLRAMLQIADKPPVFSSRWQALAI